MYRPKLSLCANSHSYIKRRSNNVLIVLYIWSWGESESRETWDCSGIAFWWGWSSCDEPQSDCSWTFVILCKTQALLFGGDEPQFRLQLHWWCYCVFGAGGAFEGEEMYTPQHVLRAPLQCIGGRWCVIQRSIGLPPCICMYSIDMCVLQTWAGWTINYGTVCF